MDCVAYPPGFASGTFIEFKKCCTHFLVSGKKGIVMTTTYSGHYNTLLVMYVVHEIHDINHLDIPPNFGWSSELPFLIFGGVEGGVSFPTSSTMYWNAPGKTFCFLPNQDVTKWIITDIYSSSTRNDKGLCTFKYQQSGLQYWLPLSGFEATRIH